MSDHASPIHPAGISDVVQRGALVMELVPQKATGAVLLDYKANEGWPRALSIFYDPTAGLVVLHRQADTLLRHHLPGPLPRDWGLARVTYAWDGPARTWSLQLQDTADGWRHRVFGSNPMPLYGADILALCAGKNATRRDASVQWFGFGLQNPAVPPMAWIGQRTPVDTTRGKIAAEDLRSGDTVITLDNGHQTLRAMHRYVLPNRGRLAPVLLRAPYFARQTDLLVSQGQLTLLSGAAVEYLFGEDAVLAPAAALRDGNSALADVRRPLTVGIALDLGKPELILADRCPLLCSPETAMAPLPYRVLHDYETLPLQSLLGRGGQRSAA